VKNSFCGCKAGFFSDDMWCQACEEKLTVEPAKKKMLAAETLGHKGRLAINADLFYRRELAQTTQGFIKVGKHWNY
jgi:hypothetical protein